MQGDKLYKSWSSSHGVGFRLAATESRCASARCSMMGCFYNAHIGGVGVLCECECLCGYCPSASDGQHMYRVLCGCVWVEYPFSDLISSIRFDTLQIVIESYNNQSGII